MAVYNDADTFSSCTSVTGPFPGLPVPLEGDDIDRADRCAPRRAPDERPAPHPRSSQAHRSPCPADAADHAQTAAGERGVHVAAGRPTDRHVPGPGRMRVHRRVRQPPGHAGHRRPPRRAGGGSSAIRRGPAPQPGRSRHHREHRPGHHGPHAARVPLPAVHRLRGGPAPLAAPGCPHRTGHGDLPRRHDARGHRCRPGGRQPVRRRPGDHGATPRLRPPAHRRGSRPPTAPPAGTSPHPQLRRGDTADGEPHQGRLPPVPGADHRRRGRPPRRHHGHAAQRRRPTATRAGSTTRRRSTSTARTPGTTWPSAAASTPAPAPRWRAPRLG